MEDKTGTTELNGKNQVLGFRCKAECLKLFLFQSTHNKGQPCSTAENFNILIMALPYNSMLTVCIFQRMLTNFNHIKIYAELLAI